MISNEILLALIGALIAALKAIEVYLMHQKNGKD